MAANMFLNCEEYVYMSDVKIIFGFSLLYKLICWITELYHQSNWLDEPLKKLGKY